MYVRRFENFLIGLSLSLLGKKVQPSIGASSKPTEAYSLATGGKNEERYHFVARTGEIHVSLCELYIGSFALSRELCSLNDGTGEKCRKNGISFSREKCKFHVALGGSAKARRSRTIASVKCLVFEKLRHERFFWRIFQESFQSFRERFEPFPA